MDFGHAIETNVNIYAFAEGKPLNQNGVHFKVNDLNIIPTNLNIALF